MASSSTPVISGRHQPEGGDANPSNGSSPRPGILQRRESMKQIRYGADRQLDHSPPIQLEKDMIEEQLKGLFNGENPSTELIKIISHPDEQLAFEQEKDVFEALITGLKNLIEEDIETKAKIFDHLAELSLDPASAFLLCQLSFEINKKELSKAIIERYDDNRVLVQSLPIFAQLALEKEKPDPTFRRGDQLSYVLGGRAVQHILGKQITELVDELSRRLDFEFNKDSKDSVKQLAKIIAEVFPRIFNIIRETPKLNSVLQSSCIAPIRKKFVDQENVEELVRFGIIDMIFLRGICPELSSPTKGNSSFSFATRCRFSAYLLRFVNGKIPSDPKREINEIWKRTFHKGVQSEFDGLIAHFIGDNN